jgi:CheY-like chemotaxis protein
VGALNARGSRTPLAEGSPDEILGVLTKLDPDADRFPDAVNPNSTLPPGTPLPRIPRPGSPEARAALADGPARPAPRADADPTPRVMRAPRDVLREAGDEAARAGAKPTIEALLAEVKVLRHLQEETLELLRSGTFTSREQRSIDVADELGLPSPPAVRARRRKKVLLIDDDRETRRATEEILDAAEIPLRVVSDGRTALAAIAEDRPDVVVMELDITRPMAGPEVVQLIKAMSPADIPIILYTRVPIASQREARTAHGADDFVSKQDGPEALLARVVMLFRQG